MTEESNKAKRSYIKYSCKTPKKVKIQISIITNLKEALLSEYLAIEVKKTKLLLDDEHLQGMEVLVSSQAKIRFAMMEYDIIIDELQEKIKKLK
jgi:hypothetical protein